MNTVPTLTAAPPEQRDEPPDWSTLDRELVCPLCEYNLRGLTVATCPECGAQHTWADLLDPRRREHPYLFEHHPERNWWSFRQTLIGGLRPQAFWTTLSPLQPTSLPRMLLYGGMVLALSLSIYIVSFAGQVFARQQTNQRGWGGWPRGTFSSFSLIDETFAGLSQFVFWLVCAIPIVWAGFTFLSFMLFDVSMHRARVKKVHIARAVIYAFDGLVLTAIGFALYYWICAAALWYASGDETQLASTIGLLWVVSLIVSYYWLTARSEFRQKRWAAILLWPVVATAVATGAMITDSIEYENDWTLRIITSVPTSTTIVLMSLTVIVGRLVVAFRQYLQFRHSVAVVIASQVITALAIPAGVVVIQAFMQML